MSKVTIEEGKGRIEKEINSEFFFNKENEEVSLSLSLKRNKRIIVAIEQPYSIAKVELRAKKIKEAFNNKKIRKVELNATHVCQNVFDNSIIVRDRSKLVLSKVKGETILIVKENLEDSICIPNDMAKILFSHLQ